MGGDPNAGMDAAPQPGAEIDQAEQDTFADLKPEQMILKNTELKERYQEVYKAATDSLEKINKISRTTYDDVMLDFIVKKQCGYHYRQYKITDTDGDHISDSTLVHTAPL